MNYLNEIKLRGTLARNPKVGKGQNGRYAFATLITKDGRSSQYHNIAAFEADLVDVLADAREGDALEIIGKLTYRKQDDVYKASIVIDDCFEPTELAAEGKATKITDRDIPF